MRVDATRRQYSARMARLLLLALSIAFFAMPMASRAGSSHDMALVGSHRLEGRSAYQPVIARQGDRWILYVGHHAGGDNGTSILDVTRPESPKLLAHIPSRGGAQMVRACGDHLLRTRGDAAHEVWNLADPAKPRLVSTVVDGLSGTHKNWWECDTGIAYLVSGVPGWRTNRMMQVYDLSNPAKPRHIRDFGLPGQQPGANGPVPTGLHGPISTGPRGNRVYLGYGTNAGGVMQILDRGKLLQGPAQPTEANLLHPQVGRLDLPPTMGAHTAFPILGVPVAEFARDAVGRTRDYVLIVNEGLVPGCAEARQMAWLADVTWESRPMTVSGYTVKEASGGYCGKGRFAAHSSNESFAPIYYRKIVFIAFFNAGVRAVDIRDPLHPVEVAHFVPDGDPVTNNVEVDERGYVYIVDRGGLGLHILRLTGAAARIAE